jgi:spermidine synthase
MVVGDARLSLARKGSASSDLLIVDAFTSDAVPMHLLTREAFDLYRRVLQPEGLLLVHITNRHLDLEPVVAAAARQGLHGLVGIYNPGAGERLAAAAPSRWIALSASPSKLRQVQAETGTDFWRPLRQSKEFGGWTDDYGSILPLLKR